MAIDPELLRDFVAEIKLLELELKGIVVSLQENIDQPVKYEQFGQIIDRIYGTAVTLGFKEMAAYCLMLKKTSYACAKQEAKRAQVRVLKLLEACLDLLGVLVVGTRNPEVLKIFKHTLHLEEQKAHKLHEEIFQYLKKAA